MMEKGGRRALYDDKEEKDEETAHGPALFHILVLSGKNSRVK
jgi:hypothetical protein